MHGSTLEPVAPPAVIPSIRIAVSGGAAAAESLGKQVPRIIKTEYHNKVRRMPPWL